MARSWDALYSWYKEYRACDDGVIAETSSAAVGNLIVAHWNTLPRFGQIAKRDVAFRQFVITHLGWTIEMEDISAKDVEALKRNSKTRCPAGLTKLCNELRTAADAAPQMSNSSKQ